ncbi:MULTISPECIES: hypothetical protein [Chitinophagaceae]
MAKVQKTGKQVHNMNSPERLDAIKAAIIAGESPRSIHEKYGTSIVNIHYHKNQLRKKGLLSDAKGKAGRKPAATTTKKAVPAKAVKAATKVTKAVKTVPAPVKKSAPAQVAIAGKGLVNIVVNGTKITTDKPVKAYRVSRKSVLIEF